MNNLNKEYIGKCLIDEGFETWFRYMFRVIENKPFVYEELHKGLFDYFESLTKQKTIRCNINVPPRSGKTTVAKYFIIYCLTINPKCNFIYTSFSQMLLSDIARDIAQILENPIYKAMYSLNTQIDSEECNPIDDFWREYLLKTEGKNIYSNKKIVTAQGGVVLFASIGSTITGFGAGIRGAKNFSGALIIDDANKPADIRSEVMRENVLRYFEETLLSRLNNSNAAIINIQQRLHLEDLSGHLIQKYNFDTLSKPLINENGVCQLPKQYTLERIEELQLNSFMFSAQYQQQPIPLGGNMIKSQWFNYYSEYPKFTKIFITADTAQKTKECNDFSVFCVWGVFETKLYLIDLIRGKWEAPELLVQVESLVKRYKIFNEKRLYEILIEDKASGTGLIQTLKRTCLVPIKPIQVDKDKVTRVDDALPFLANGYFYLPYNSEYGFNKDLIKECELFARDMSHKHDDIVDNITMAIQYISRKTTIYDAL